MRKPDLNIRVAVTGAGIICSIGSNKGEVWRSICESRAAIRKLTRFRGESFPTDLAAEVDGDVQKMLPIGKRAARRLSRSDVLAVIAAAGGVGQANGDAWQALPIAPPLLSGGPSTEGPSHDRAYHLLHTT